MRLLVADRFPEPALEELRLLGLDVDYRPSLDRDSLPEALGGVGILVVRSTEVSARAFDLGRELNLVIRAGAGTSNIDVRAASARGVYVANCPGRNANAVAELVYGLILSLDRRIPDAVASLRAGRWERAEFSGADGLSGKTLGVAGLGAIGRDVASRARAFGMTPHAWSRALSPSRAQEAGVVHAPSLQVLASRSDVLSLHLPITPATKGIVGRAVLEALPDRAMLVNTARADLIDLQALAEIAPKKRLRVALDVWQGEPRTPGEGYASPLLSLEGALVYGTPHIAAQTTQAQRAIAAEVVRIARSFLVEGNVPNVVNVCGTSPARYQLVVRHLDKIGVLANVLGVIKRHGINVEEVSNTVFDGATAACVKIRLAGRPSEACLHEINAFSDEVMHVDLVALPMRA